jgi:hypothetical protein
MLKLRLRTLILVRVAGCIVLSTLLGFQVYYVVGIRRPDITLFDDIPPENYTIADFNRTFPWDMGHYDIGLAEAAAAFFHLPAWSPAYRSCDAHPEFSCFELVRAYLRVSSYFAKYDTDELIGYVKVNIPNRMALHCRISTFYNSFLISLFTNRRLVLITNGTTAHWLREPYRSRFAPPAGFSTKSRIIPHNYTFPCEELMRLDEVIEFAGCMWPQVSYIHPDLAHKIRSVFSFHAAHLILNLLVDVDAPGCASPHGNVAVGAFHVGAEWSLGERDFSQRASGCAGGHAMAVIEESEAEADAAHLCKMRQMIGAQKIVYAFGSVTGWLAMAMQGARGAVAELDGRRCIELRSSQAGSIVHTYNPRKFFHYSTNNDFLVCGPNYNDARLFMRYLMW